MHKYGELLKKCVSESGLSINAFTNKLGINRGQFYNICSGSKNLSEEKFADTLRLLNLPEEKADSLRIAYFREKYGERSFKRMIQIKNLLSSFECAGELKPYFADFSFDGAVTGIQGKNELLGAAKFVIDDALNSESGTLYANFPFENTSIDTLLYTSLERKPYTIDFRLFAEYKSDVRSDENIRRFFSYAKYLKVGFKCLAYYHKSFDSERKNLLYPFFLFSDRFLLMFDYEGSLGLITNEESVMTAARSTVQRMESGAKMQTFDLRTYKNADPSFEFVINSQSDKFDFSGCSGIGDHICLAKSYENKDFVRKITNPELPYSELVISAVQRIYSISNNYNFISSERSFYDFAKMGVVNELPACYTVALDNSLKKQALEVIKEQIQQNCYFILKDSVLSLPAIVCFEVGENRTTAFMTYENEKFASIQFFESKDLQLNEDFKNFISYLKCSDFVMQKESAVDFVERIITGLELLDIDSKT